MTSNLLIIMSDEHQSRAMGCAGHPFVKTPHLDALAARGQRFTNAYTPSPICVPARASFATGLYAHQTRMWDNAMPYDGSIRGWGHALQDKGVRVESIGKLHYRAQEDAAGFDVEHIPMMVVDGVGMVWGSIRKENERVSPSSRMLGEYIGPGTSKYTQYDEAVTKRTEQWLAKAKGDAPWCLYVGLVAPHFPLVCAQEFYDMYPPGDLPEPKQSPASGYKRHPWIEKQNAIMDSEAHFRDGDERRAAMAAYYGLTSAVDHNVGRILKALTDAGLSDDTTVIYTSDHGDNVGARGLWGKSNFYEESAAVPMIMAGPGVNTGETATPVSLIDISQTIVHHFDAETPKDDRGDRPGASLYDITAALDAPDRAVFSEYHAVGAVTGGFMLRKGDWKLIHYVGFKPELFNLAEDPEEQTNRAADADCAAALADMYAGLREICDPEAMDELAHADQAAMVERYGGREAALKLGAPAATPPPEVLE
ncbi:MAG: sulfatase-like hydrolase/transferase [Pikeienuella sp.]